MNQITQRRLALCTALAATTLNLTPVFAAAGAGWYDNFDEAVAAAKREGKPILADFSATWCGACKQLERTTFPDPNVAARMDNFIKVHVDADENQDLANSFRIEGLPTLVALQSNGKDELDRSIGYLSPTQLSARLDQVISRVPAKSAAPEKSNAAKEVSSKDGAAKDVAVSSAHQHQATISSVANNSNRLQNEIATAQQAASHTRLNSPPAEPDRSANFYTMSAAADSNRNDSQVRLVSRQSGASDWNRIHQGDGAAAIDTSARERMVPGGGDADAEERGSGAAANYENVSSRIPRKTMELAQGELPKPMLNAGSARDASAAASTDDSSASPAASDAKETPNVEVYDNGADSKAKKSTGASAESKKSASKPTGGSAGKGGKDVLATIRKLQNGSGDTGDSAPVDSGTAAASAGEPAEKPAAKIAVKKPAEKAPADSGTAAVPAEEPVEKPAPKIAVKKPAEKAPAKTESDQAVAPPTGDEVSEKPAEKATASKPTVKIPIKVRKPQTDTASASAKSESNADASDSGETKKTSRAVPTGDAADESAAPRSATASTARRSSGSDDSVPARDAGSDDRTAARASSDSSATDAVDANATDKPAEVTADDVDRWMKDGDAKLVAGHKKEARAMYSKIVDSDPKSKNGQTDLAYIKMVSLMVDKDDDAVRNQAYKKITEFANRFPNSRHKDYYTVIRAMLAADLGKNVEAHSLLDDFPDRFPDSSYAKMAHETWQALPESTGKGRSGGAATASASGATRGESASALRQPAER